MTIAWMLGIFLLCSPLSALAADSVEAPSRTNGQNYKDRALASCLADAYKGTPAGEDADVTKSIFLEWTYYDDAKGNPATDRLVEKYLRRNYGNPFEGYAGAKFDLLKCLDMYHSRDLEDQVRKYVRRPERVGDRPAGRKRR